MVRLSINGISSWLNWALTIVGWLLSGYTVYYVLSGKDEMQRDILKKSIYRTFITLQAIFALDLFWGYRIPFNASHGGDGDNFDLFMTSAIILGAHLLYFRLRLLPRRGRAKEPSDEE